MDSNVNIERTVVRDSINVMGHQTVVCFVGEIVIHIQVINDPVNFVYTVSRLFASHPRPRPLRSSSSCLLSILTNHRVD